VHEIYYHVQTLVARPICHYTFITIPARWNTTRKARFMTEEEKGERAGDDQAPVVVLDDSDPESDSDFECFFNSRKPKLATFFGGVPPVLALAEKQPRPPFQFEPLTQGLCEPTQLLRTVFEYEPPPRKRKRSKSRNQARASASNVKSIDSHDSRLAASQSIHSMDV
jgi:hypothetical protein